MADSIIRFRIGPQVKEEASKLFRHMGLNTSEAIRLFLYQSVAEKRIPFSINIPNTKTKMTLKKANCGKDIESTTLKQLSKDWDAECGK